MSRVVALALCVFVAVIAVGECVQKQQRGLDGGGGTCKYWCQDNGGNGGRKGRSVGPRGGPMGADDGIKYYCCDDNPIPTPKNRVCPPERAVCPQNQGLGNVAPNECRGDSDCRGTDMCCPDVCLKHRTCKPSQALGARRG